MSLEKEEKRRMNLAIIGRGEMALELFSLITSCEKKEKYESIYFVDLVEDKNNNTLSEEEYFKSDRSASEVLIAMGEPYMREKMFEKYEENGFKFATFIHPMSFVSGNTFVGEGSIILPFCYVAQNTKIGKNVILHSGSIIENDCIIGNNCFVSSNSFVGAKTKIDDTCFIGPSSSIRDDITIGKNSIIGMGSVVTKSVEPNAVCFGNPATKARDNITNKVFK